MAPVAWARTPVVASFLIFPFYQKFKNKKLGVSPEGIEPPTFGFGIRRATNYAIGSAGGVVSPEGIEPPTFGFGIRRATNYAIGSVWDALKKETKGKVKR